MTVFDKINIHNMPMAKGIWKTMGSNLTDVAQAICEFVDNAISNFRGNPGDVTQLRHVKISLVNLGTTIEISVEDSGTGIKDLHNALTLAGTEGRESPLNEHGFGLKHALAYMDENNCKWEILTRTEEDCRFNRFARITPPYDFDGMKASYEEGWPGELSDTGTLVRFTCPLEVFETLAQDTKTKRTFEQLVAILSEHLRYIYADILKRGEMVLSLSWKSSGMEHSKFLTPLLPQWQDGTLVELPDQVFNLGGGDVTISCRYGSICPDEEAHSHYIGNMESSGAEIRVNGRVVESGLMRAIWKRATHNVFNQFLVQVDLRSDNPDALPATRTAKNGFRHEKRKALNLFAWIQSNVTLPIRVSKEHELLRKLAEIMRHKEGVTYVQEEKHVFERDEVNVPVDLFVSRGNKVTLFECKAKRSSCLNCYQLCMYWDGSLRDGLQVEEGILIAHSHPLKVRRLAKVLSLLPGPDGVPRKIRLTTWAEEGVAV